MPHFNIVGVDIALRRSGICVYNTETKKYNYFGVMTYNNTFDYQFNSIIDYKRQLYAYMEKNVMPYTNPRLPYLFSVEGITRKGHYHTTIKIMLARSMMFNYINDKEYSGKDFTLYEVLSPTVQDWKKELLGKANASKEETYNWLRERRQKYAVPLPIYDDDDILDAACLAIYALESLT